MKSRAHTTGLLFQLDQRNWVCAWCARHHTNLFLYDRYIPTCYKLLYDKKYRDQPILHSYYIISIIISVFKTQIRTRSLKYCLCRYENTMHLPMISKLVHHATVYTYPGHSQGRSKFGPKGDRVVVRVGWKKMRVS